MRAVVGGGGDVRAVVGVGRTRTGEGCGGGREEGR